MSALRWSPPAIGAVRAFEATSRLKSFTAAAGELGVTQSAISHSVRDLEHRLGVKLLIRARGRLELSDAGSRYVRHAAEALRHLKAADESVASPTRRSKILTVSVSPSFAAKWLAPRLGTFSAANPDLDLRVSATPQHIDFSDGEFDLALRHGDGNWPDLHCTRLCSETIFPARSPWFLKGRSLKSPEALLSLALIHHRDVSGWKSWLAHFGVAATARALRGAQYNEMHLVIDAAVSNQGVALVRSALAQRDLEEGRLVRALAQEIVAPYAYWIVCPKPSAEEPKIIRFRKWLLTEAAPGPAMRDALAVKPKRTRA